MEGFLTYLDHANTLRNAVIMPKNIQRKELDGMNVSLMGIGTDTYKKGSVFAGGLPMLQNNGLKSTQEKLERQQKAQNQVSFWEKQKENLKDVECDTIEDIAKKLDSLHEYEDEIAAAKKAFNNEQMWHVMDEARERGEKIAEAAEKMETKTPEERKEEMAEEALGTEENKGALEEMLDEATDVLEEITDLEQEAVDAKQNAGELADLTKETQDVQDNEGEMADLSKETQDMQDDKGEMAGLDKEAQSLAEQRQEEQEKELAAMRQLHAYQAPRNKYLYQAMDIKV